MITSSNSNPFVSHVDNSWHIVLHEIRSQYLGV